MDPAAKPLMVRSLMVRSHDARAADPGIDRLDHCGRVRDCTWHGDRTFLVIGAVALILQAIVDRLFC